MMPLQTDVMTITPELARKWLEENTRNRSVSRKKVRQYKDDMEHGRWSKTHQGIAFYETGELSDGQHRLIALIEAGTPVEMMVTHGIPIEAGADIDRHRPRGDIDAIKIGGLADWIGKDEVPIIKMVAAVHKKAAPTYSAKHIADLGSYIEEQVEFAVNAFHSRKKYITTSPVMAAVAIASDHVDQARLLEFCEVLITGMPQQGMEDSAAIRLREQLINDQGRGGYNARRDTVYKTMRAIKAFNDRKAIQKLYTPQDMLYRIEGIEEYL